MKPTAVFIIGALATMISVPAIAGPHEHHRKGEARMIDEWDADKDGIVSRDEFDSHVQTSFERADTDGNGSIDIVELSAFRRTKEDKRRFSRIDSNDDKAVSFDEFAERANRGFERMDSNENGVIDDRDKRRKRRHRDRPDR